MDKVIKKLIAQLGKTGWTVSSSTDRKTVMKGADFIVNCIEVSGVGCVRFDNDIPLKYGVSQCIGDTIGPGGIFKGLRTIPSWLAILSDAEKLCPNALVLNYTNPMSMMCTAAARASKMPVVGLCHSVQGSSHGLAKWFDVPYEEVNWECAGINHLAWFIKFEHKGKDLYPAMIKKAKKEIETHKGNWDEVKDLVRKDMMIHFGAYITESSGHLSEYLPYYRKRAELIKKYCGPKYEGQESFYADEWPGWRIAADNQRKKWLTGEEPMGWERSWEYASWIIEANIKDSPFRIHGNVPNTQDGSDALIPNILHDGVVEVPVMIDRRGFNPVRVGKLPQTMAAICDSNVRVFDIAADAAVNKSVELTVQAMMLDPLCSAVLSPAEIRAMTLDMFKAEKKFLPGYK